MPKFKKRLQVANAVLSEICRVCLNSHKRMLSLFEPHQESSIGSQLTALADVKVSTGDGLPDRICRGCLAELRAALLFRQKCRHSDRQLRGLPSEPVEVKKEEFEYEFFLENSAENEDENLFVENTGLHEPNSLVKNIAKEETAIQEAIDDPAEKQFFEDSFEDDIVKTEMNEQDQYNKTDNKEEIDFEKTESIDPAYMEQNVVKNQEIFKSLKSHFQCHDCEQIFRTKFKLRVHWKNTHKPKSYTCDICRRVFKTLKTYVNHKKKKTKACKAIGLAGVRVEGEGKSRVFYCSHCHFESKWINTVITHLLSHSGKKFQCNLCPKIYTQKASLQNHKVIIHSENKMEHTCFLCGKNIRNKQAYTKHLRTHSTERNYQCDECKKQFKNRCHLISHLKLHTGLKKYVCDLCGAQYYTSSSLAHHKSITHINPIPLLKCEFCSFESKKPARLAKHQIQHTASNFVCTRSRCYMFFESEERLRIHEQIHIDRRRHECNLCDSRFPRWIYLAAHLKRKHDVVVNDKVKLKRDIKIY